MAFQEELDATPTKTRYDRKGRKSPARILQVDTSAPAHDKELPRFGCRDYALEDI